MWLITTEGFYSAVQDKRDPETLVIRARKHEHLKALRKRVPEASPIQTGGGTDYPYRVRVPRQAWMLFVARHAGEVTYTNFKDAVRSHSDHNVYLRVWGVLRGLTPSRSRSRRRRSHSADELPLYDHRIESDPWPLDDPLRP